MPRSTSSLYRLDCREWVAAQNRRFMTRLSRVYQLQYWVRSASNFHTSSVRSRSLYPWECEIKSGTSCEGCGTLSQFVIASVVEMEIAAAKHRESARHTSFQPDSACSRSCWESKKEPTEHWGMLSLRSPQHFPGASPGTVAALLASPLKLLICGWHPARPLGPIAFPRLNSWIEFGQETEQ